eukprot:COSAG06_NODE_968_length_11280_cov_125.578302_13_plen_196_part_00
MRAASVLALAMAASFAAAAASALARASASAPVHEKACQKQVDDSNARSQQTLATSVHGSHGRAPLTDAFGLHALSLCLVRRLLRASRGRLVLLLLLWSQLLEHELSVLAVRVDLAHPSPNGKAQVQRLHHVVVIRVVLIRRIVLPDLSRLEYLTCNPISHPANHTDNRQHAQSVKRSYQRFKPKSLDRTGGAARA